MYLSKKELENINFAGLIKPELSTFDLPEKVLQFGTGVLLRGLPDYFINKANLKGIFNGRIVVVKSTDQGDSSGFEDQDNLYTICVRGIKNGNLVTENIISSAISRVLSAKQDWQSILDCAKNQKLKIIISNTTEAGIQLVEEDINQTPPQSFPAKLLAFLYRRYQVFDGKSEAGMVIIPTELIPENGKKLAAIILALARFNKLDETFISWLTSANQFCNSLVDRIVPGKPDKETLQQMEAELGYQDNLLICAEPYKLWAIEAPESVKEILSFRKADDAVIVKDNIDKYRELKLRLLNGTHSFCCGLAFLSGFTTVKQAMENEDFVSFIEALLFDEIVPTIPYNIPEEEKKQFGKQVLDRFRNPTIAHEWLSISLSYTAKMKMRNKDLIINYYKLFNKIPEHFAKGFAAYLMFMKPIKVENGKYFGEFKGNNYLINDTQASYFKHAWESSSIDNLVQEVLGNELLWDYNLNQLLGFSAAVIKNLRLLQEKK